MTTGPIENFFFAWGAPDERRDAIIREAVADDVIYTDPRGEVSGFADLAAYVSQYSANAPDSHAEVVEDVAEGRVHDVRVRFHGPWGEHFGRYKVTLGEHGRIARAEGVAEKNT